MDAAHDKLYGRIADLLAQEAQKRNGNLVGKQSKIGS